jgi:hypothetical protein
MREQVRLFPVGHDFFGMLVRRRRGGSMKTARAGLATVLALRLLASACACAAGENSPQPIATDWGRIRFQETSVALEIAAGRLPGSGIVRMPRLNNPVAAVYLQEDQSRKPLKLAPGVREWEITLPMDKGGLGNLVVIVETVGRPLLASEPQVIAADPRGIISLPAHHAVTHGERLRYEPQPHKNTVGYWTEVGDWCQWHFAVERPGRYEVQILQGCGKGQGGSEVAVQVGEQELLFTVEETGHFQNFKRRTVGTLTLAAGKSQTLTLHPRTKAASAIMDVRQIQLVPLHPES